MKRLPTILIFFLMIAPVPAASQERVISLAVSPLIRDSGLMKYLLPRFSLKTGVTVNVADLVAEGTVPPEADVIISTVQVSDETIASRAVMTGLGQTYFAYTRHPDDAEHSQAQLTFRFIDWLFSEVGKRTIEKYERDGVRPFTAVTGPATANSVAEFSGDQKSGENLAYRMCGRCHVIGERNRMKGLGSTPSFALMRTFADWPRRFEAFYTLNPHPSFSQITGVTLPFDPSRPPPISPIELTVEQLDDIVAFVATVEPADLGAPIPHQ